MNARGMAMVAIVLSFGSFTLEESALAQEARGVAESRDVDCHTVQGKARDTWPGAGNVSTGVMNGSHLLRGTTQYVYDTDGFPTPDVDMVTFGAELTLTTKHGIVVARVVFLFNVATGTWTSIATLDPDTSTGRFAGATGTLWFPRGKTIDPGGGAQTYPSDVTGRLCLAGR